MDDAKRSDASDDNEFDGSLDELRDELISVLSQWMTDEWDSDEDSTVRGHPPVSADGFEVVDPTFEDPDGEVSPDAYDLFHQYWPALMHRLAPRADRFGVDCWADEARVLAAAGAVGGTEVGRRGDTIRFEGPTGEGWLDRFDKECWGERGDLLFFNVYLLERGKCTLFSSHYGGELIVWVPEDMD